MLSIIKQKIPEIIKGEILYCLSSSSDKEYERIKNKKKVIIALCGFYQNLGDMALTYSQKRFLENTFPDREIILLPSTNTYSKLKALKKNCTSTDIVTIIGGGNMDDTYVSLEDCRRFIVKKFSKNRIISFPQTIAFSDTPYGKKRLKKSINTYSKHKDLTFFAREVKSFEIMKKCFPKNYVYLCPDMVLSLDKVNPQKERTKVVSCIRDDKENFLTHQERALLKVELSNNYPFIIYTDTVNVSPEDCKPKTYEQTLNRFWSVLREAKIVVTDRLHCMIFCVITKTPCVVLNNSNNKIKRVYDKWLKSVSYIRFFEKFDVADVLSGMDELSMLDVNLIESFNLTSEFEKVKKIVKGKSSI